MFKFYTTGFKMTEQVINIRYLKPMSKTDKAWSKKIAIEGEWQVFIIFKHAQYFRKCTYFGIKDKKFILNMANFTFSVLQIPLFRREI